MNSTIINWEEYVKKSDIVVNSAPAIDIEWLPLVLVRTYAAWVYVWYLQKEDDKNLTAILINARRMWRWEWASDVGELATRGTSKPSECKFPAQVPLVRLKQVVEVIPVTEQAKASIDSVAVWSS